MVSYSKIVSPLLDWYEKNHRNLPWREGNDPYRIWVSEIMLQQTRVEAVKDYYSRFLQAFPTVYHLAQATEDSLMKLWEGLGYYSRAKNLQKAAKIIVERYDGKFPGVYEDILSLPGVGEYTAGAIASIAFNLPYAAVDGNVLRVLSRLSADDAFIDDPKTKKRAFEALTAVYPVKAGDFTQSIMELGATVCVPNGAPHCNRCPLAHLCISHKKGEEQLRPFKKPKKERTKADITVFLLRAGNLYAIEKREEKGVLFGLYQFPSIPGQTTLEQRIAHLESLGAHHLKVGYETHKKHVFTHVEWNMTATVFRCEKPFGPFLWVTEEEVSGSIGLPSAFRTFFPFS